jgi:uncharacterized membrane protein YhaH (DUF805 family)
MGEAGQEPGWYPDPTEASLLRWWTGREWSSRTQPGEGSRSAGATPRTLPGLPTPAGPPVSGPSSAAWDAPIPLDIGGSAIPSAPQRHRSASAPAGGYGAPTSLAPAVVDAFRRMFRWGGRTSRGGFWWMWVAAFIFQIGAAVFDEYVIATYPGYEALPYFDPSIPVFVDIVSVLLLPLSIAFAIAQLGVGVRRMHDIGRSGWWLLVPFYNLYLATRPSDPAPNRWG